MPKSKGYVFPCFSRGQRTSRAMSVIKAIASFFYRLLGYAGVAEEQYDRGYMAGLDDGWQDARDAVMDWYVPDEDDCCVD